MLYCDRCPDRGCLGRLGQYAGGCPTSLNQPLAQKAAALYEGADAELATVAFETVRYARKKLTRIEEIMAFARLAGYSHLGVAFCSAMIKEAGIACQVFRDNGFAVSSAICKVGALPQSVVQPQVPCPETGGKALCNPAMQADLLNQEGSQLNVLLGLCVGHDSLFMRHSLAPCTVLGVRDWVTGHNPLEPLYQHEAAFSFIHHAPLPDQAVEHAPE